MAPFCVMCDALGHTACVSDCPYATLVFEGAINPLQLKTILYRYKASFIHSEMTAAAEEDRAAVMQWFWYLTRTRMEDAGLGAAGAEERLAQIVAADEAVIRKLKAEIATAMEEVEEQLRELIEDDVVLTVLEAAGFAPVRDSD